MRGRQLPRRAFHTPLCPPQGGNEGRAKAAARWSKCRVAEAAIITAFELQPTAEFIRHVQHDHSKNFILLVLLFIFWHILDLFYNIFSAFFPAKYYWKYDLLFKSSLWRFFYMYSSREDSVLFEERHSGHFSMLWVRLNFAFTTFLCPGGIFEVSAFS